MGVTERTNVGLGVPWRLDFAIPLERVERWRIFFANECRKRDWRASGGGEVTADINKGIETIDRPGGGRLTLEWSWAKGGPLLGHATPTGEMEFPKEEAQHFLAELDRRTRHEVPTRVWIRGPLGYEGLAWRGELWLNDSLRLGPPAKHDEWSPIGPRIVMVDTYVETLDQLDVMPAADVTFRELALFLSVIMRTDVRPVPTHGNREWTNVVHPDGTRDYEVHARGYFEPVTVFAMPDPGLVAAVPLVPTSRPDLAERGIDIVDEVEQRMPADTADLWHTLQRLGPRQRQTFKQAAGLLQAGFRLGSSHETASVALIVAACEALEPSTGRSRDRNIYDVIASLIGDAVADRVESEFGFQRIRNAYFHAGAVRGGEFVGHLLTSAFFDPTFMISRGRLVPIATALMIEWLSRRGEYQLKMHRANQ
jgi:hypothetical protein